MCPHNAIHREIRHVAGNLFVLSVIRCSARTLVCDDCFYRWLESLDR